MRFRILGPLEIDADGGEPVRIRAAKQRTLLVILLLHANRPVSVDRLAAALWPGRRPRSAAANMRTYMSALRQALRLTGRDSLPRLSGQPGGYRLDLRPPELDLLVFEDLAATGGQALGGGDHAGAARLLGDALRLWRGRAAEDVAVDGEAAIALVGLEERRLAVEEAWVDAQLAVGDDDAQVIVRLRNLVAHHPLRERLWGQLMTALYRTGRGAEALAAFQELRGQLSDELGVQPGPSLQRLHQQILTGDTPDSPPPRTARRTAAVPLAQLPPDITSFTGRAAQIRRLSHMLAARDADRPAALVISAISGTAGVGKTALAVHWAHQVAESFGDGQLHIDLRGYAASQPVEPLDALARFLHALGVPAEQVPGELDEAAAMYRSLLAGKRMLILVDNAATSGQVRPLLPGSPGCLVLVTSRGRLPGLTAREGAARVTLAPLPQGEALALLQNVLGRARVDAESDAAAEIATRCACLPLALRIAADRAADRPKLTLAGLAAQLAATRGRLDVLAADDDNTSTALRSVFSWSYQALAPDAARMFRLLGLHPGPDVSVPAAAALAATSHAAAGQLLQALAGVHLLEETSPDRYQFHDLLRIYAAERATIDDSARDRPHARRRVLTWYLHTAAGAAHLLAPWTHRIPLGRSPRDCEPAAFADYEHALAWCDAEHANLVAAVRLAAETGLDDITWKLAATLRGYFDLRKPWTDWIITHQAGLASARRAGDVHGEFWMINGLGHVYCDLRRFEDALSCCRRALELRRQAGDRRGESACLNNLGTLYGELRRLDSALECNHQALSICRETGDRVQEAAALHGLGQLHRKRDRPEQALHYLAQALAILRVIGERRGESVALLGLGETHLDLRRTSEARGHSQQALAICRQIGDRRGEADALRILGDACYHAGQAQAADRSWSQALAIFDDLDDPQADEVRDRLARARRGIPARA